jgi:hypothetical protein
MAWSRILFRWGCGDSGYMVLSVWIIAIRNAVIIWKTFVIGRVGPTTSYTCSRSITWFGAIAGVMLPTAFYAGLGLVALSLRMSILLVSSTLWYAGVCARRFKVNNSLLDGCQVVDILIIDCRF